MKVNEHLSLSSSVRPSICMFLSILNMISYEESCLFQGFEKINFNMKSTCIVE